jgi:hypothetical protein
MNNQWMPVTTLPEEERQYLVACGFAAASIVSGVMTREDAVGMYAKKGLPLALEMLRNSRNE